jgi:putative toxin-antitoxin system antitoxin component (TIGR02293 family)
MRINYVTTRSGQAFEGRPGYSSQWLCTPNPALEGQTPLESLASERGFETVKDLLTKIEHGIYT